MVTSIKRAPPVPVQGVSARHTVTTFESPKIRLKLRAHCRSRRRDGEKEESKKRREEQGIGKRDEKLWRDDASYVCAPNSARPAPKPSVAIRVHTVALSRAARPGPPGHSRARKASPEPRCIFKIQYPEVTFETFLPGLWRGQRGRQAIWRRNVGGFGAVFGPRD